MSCHPYTGYSGRRGVVTHRTVLMAVTSLARGALRWVHICAQIGYPMPSYHAIDLEGMNIMLLTTLSCYYHAIMVHIWCH